MPTAQTTATAATATTDYEIEVVFAGGNQVRYRAVVRLGREVVGMTGAAKCPHTALAAGRSLAEKHRVGAVAGYEPGLAASTPVREALNVARS